MEFATLEKNEDDEVIWSGPDDAVAFIGYPFIVGDHIRKQNEDGSLGTIMKVRYALLDVGIPLIPLYWDEPTQCFACVRADKYEVVN